MYIYQHTISYLVSFFSFSSPVCSGPRSRAEPHAIIEITLFMVDMARSMNHRCMDLMTKNNYNAVQYGDHTAAKKLTTVCSFGLYWTSLILDSITVNWHPPKQGVHRPVSLLGRAYSMIILFRVMKTFIIFISTCFGQNLNSERYPAPSPCSSGS